MLSLSTLLYMFYIFLIWELECCIWQSQRVTNFFCSTGTKQCMIELLISLVQPGLPDSTYTKLSLALLFVRLLTASYLSRAAMKLLSI